MASAQVVRHTVVRSRCLSDKAYLRPLRRTAVTSRTRKYTAHEKRHYAQNPCRTAAVTGCRGRVVVRHDDNGCAGATTARALVLQERWRGALDARGDSSASPAGRA